MHFRQRQVLLHEVQVPCHCDGHDREELFPGEQWYNMPEEAQEGQEGSEGQEEQEGETRAEREMREDLCVGRRSMVHQERKRGHRG